MPYRPRRRADLRSASRRFPLAALLTLALGVLAGCSTFKPATDADRAEVETVAEHALSQGEAFDRLMRWAAETYNSANHAVQLSDRERGEIVVQGYARLPAGAGAYYTMTMDVRDGRLRFRQSIGDFRGAEPSDYLSTGEAARVREHFAVLRASALAALADDDDF